MKKKMTFKKLMMEYVIPFVLVCLMYAVVLYIAKLGMISRGQWR